MRVSSSVLVRDRMFLRTRVVMVSESVLTEMGTVFCSRDGRCQCPAAWCSWIYSHRAKPARGRSCVCKENLVGDWCALRRLVIGGCGRSRRGNSLVYAVNPCTLTTCIWRFRPVNCSILPLGVVRIAVRLLAERLPPSNLGGQVRVFSFGLCGGGGGSAAVVNKVGDRKLTA